MDEELMKIKFKTLEIVGLDGKKCKTMCGLHTTCGSFVRPGMYLKLLKGKLTVSVQVNVPIESTEQAPPKRGRPKKSMTETQTVIQLKEVDCIKVYRWENAIEGCLVGIVAEPFQAVYGNKLDGRIVYVDSLASDSTSMSERAYSDQNNGLAMVRIVA